MQSTAEQREGTYDAQGLGLGAIISYWAGLLVRHIWTILAVFVVTTALGYWYIQQQPNIYQAGATVLVSPESDHVRALSPLGGGGDPSAGFFAGRMQLSMQEHYVRSPEVMQAVADRLQLRNDRSFLGLEDSELGDDEIAERFAGIDVAQMLRGQVMVQADPERRVVRIQMISRDAELAARVVNAVAEEYVARNLERQLEATERAHQWLQAQSAMLRGALEDSELAQLEYLRGQGTLSVSMHDRRNLGVQVIDELTNQLAGVRLEADRLGSTVRQIRAFRSLDDLLASNIPEVLANQMIQGFKSQLVALEERDLELRERYGEAWPERRALQARRELIEEVLAREIQNVLGSYEQRYETARLLERTVAERLNSAQGDVLRSGESEIAFNALRREAETNRELFGMMERRLKELELHRMLQHNNLSVLETAMVPRVPIRPRRTLMLFATLLLAAFLAIAAAYALELMDQTLKPDTNFDSEFGVGLLGVLPELKHGRGKGKKARMPGRGEEFSPDVYVHDFPRSGMAEACRSIRTNLLFMDQGESLRRLLVTSSGPREGKTLTTVSLATVFAQSGAKTVVVDADMRKPRLSRVFANAGGPGLTNVLVGEATVDEAVQETGIPNLYVLPCGPIPPNPSEILLSEAFRELQAGLDERFDRVIFDTPPVGPVADARVLSGAVGGVVLVGWAGRTQKGAFARTVDDLDAVQANLLGVVLNGLDFEKRGLGGGYYRYYYQQYSQYYGDPDESRGASTSA